MVGSNMKGFNGEGRERAQRRFQRAKVSETKVDSGC